MLGGLDLGHAKGAVAVHDLALQVAAFHHVKVHQAQGADAGRRQVQADGRTQAASADDQHLGFLEVQLAFATDTGQGDVAHVALYFFVAQGVDIDAARGGEQHFDLGFFGQQVVRVDQRFLGGKQEVLLELVVFLVEQVRTQLWVAAAEVFNDFAQCRSGTLKGRFRQLGHANQNVGERDSVHGQLRVQVVERLKGEMFAIPGK